jgi:DNA-binding transcriptional ArsR family regulator
MGDPKYFEPAQERTIFNLETLQVLFDPMRTRILKALAHQPRTVNEIAKELDVPFTRLYYHMNLLEKHGLVQVVSTRALTPAVEEKYYQVTAYMFVIDRSLLTVGGKVSDSGLEAALHDALDQTKDDIRRSALDGVIDLTCKSPDPRALLMRQGFVRLTPEQAQRLYERLVNLLVETLAQESSDEGAQYYGLTVAFYPSGFPTLPDESDPPASD